MQKIYIGAKIKKSFEKGKHNKYSDDNLRRKCKHLILKSMLDFINRKISVEIPLKSEDYLIKHDKSNNISGKNGIITLIYQLEKLEQKDTY